MGNCTQCVNYDAKEEKCKCEKSQYCDDFVNNYMICREFKEKQNVECQR